MPYCENRGEELQEDSKYCSECGHKIAKSKASKKDKQKGSQDLPKRSVKSTNNRSTKTKTNIETEFILKNYDHYFTNYKNLVTPAINIVTPEYYSSKEFCAKQKTSKLVLKRTQNTIATFLAIVKGYSVDDEKSYGEDYIAALCFPKRFLGVNSLNELHQDLESDLANLIDDTYFLGFMIHMFDWRQPTRDLADKVNIKSLNDIYLINALVADKALKGYYNKTTGRLP